MYERLAVCMWASVSMRRAALCAASVSSWGGTVRNARVLHVACRFAKTARLRATSFAWGLRRPAMCGGLSWSRHPKASESNHFSDSLPDSTLLGISDVELYRELLGGAD